MPVQHSSTTDGSRSMNMALGKCLPSPISAKKVLKESSAFFVPGHLTVGLNAVLDARAVGECYGSVMINAPRTTKASNLKKNQK